MRYGKANVCKPTSSEPSQSGEVSFRAKIVSVTIWNRAVGGGITLMNSAFELSSVPKELIPVTFGTTTWIW